MRIAHFLRRAVLSLVACLPLRLLEKESAERKMSVLIFFIALA
jgi:hypothetical protein